MKTSSHGLHYTGKITGALTAVRGPVLICRLPCATIGDMCAVQRLRGGPLPAQVIAFCDDLVTLAPLEEPDGIAAGCEIINTARPLQVVLRLPLTGRVLDAMGRDLQPEMAYERHHESGLVRLDPFAPPPRALERVPVAAPCVTGIRVLDALCTVGRGQRIGLFAPAGSGKSSLLGMLARSSAADVNVIALIGERGREVVEFLDQVISPEVRARTVLVVATSDESPQRRRLAAFTATAIAEHFRGLGKSVLLLMDSLTRTARAIREMGLAAGELPIRQGYTPSVYTTLPRLLERTGNDGKGSITAVYSVLTARNEGDPLEEEIKSLLDGHIRLDDSAALGGLRPAVDILSSISRLMPRLHSEDHLADCRLILRLLARVRSDRDLLIFGGTPDPELSCALRFEPEIRSFMHQGLCETAEYSESLARLKALCGSIRAELPGLAIPRAG